MQGRYEGSSGYHSKVQAFRAALADWQSEASCGAPPATLFHYTNGAGLLGIVQNHALWATHSRYLNDSSESVYGLEVLAAAIDQHLSQTSNVMARKVLESLKGPGALAGEDCYVACFCEDGNLLNQWRVYAPNDGYCVEFDAGRLKFCDGESHPYSLVRVVYVPTEQHDLLDALLRRVVTFCELHFLAGDYLGMATTLRVEMHQRLVHLLLTFKHPAFAVEKEWRLLHRIRGAMGAAKYRAGRFGLTPYVEFRPRGAGTEELLPITRVRCGPASTPDLARSAAKGLLQSANYHDAEVGGTDLPIRL